MLDTKRVLQSFIYCIALVKKEVKVSFVSAKAVSADLFVLFNVLVSAKNLL